MEYEKVTDTIIGCVYRVHPVEYVPSEKFNSVGATCSENVAIQYGNPTFPYKDHLQNHLIMLPMFITKLLEQDTIVISQNLSSEVFPHVTRSGPGI